MPNTFRCSSCVNVVDWEGWGECGLADRWGPSIYLNPACPKFQHSFLFTHFVCANCGKKVDNTKRIYSAEDLADQWPLVRLIEENCCSQACYDEFQAKLERSMSCDGLGEESA